MKKIVLFFVLLANFLNAQQKIEKLVIAGPFASVSHPILHMIETNALSDVAKSVEFRLWKNPDELRALVVKPSLLFLDEPFSALDIGLKRELQTHLLEEVSKEGTTILFITHDLMEAVRLSDKVLLLKAEPGHIVKEFDFEVSQELRDDKFVYNEVAKMLQDETIVDTFELEIR